MSHSLALEERISGTKLIKISELINIPAQKKFGNTPF